MGENTTVTLVEEGGTIVGTIVNAFTEMSGGMIDALKTGFDKLVLNEAGTGLSMFAIWALVFMGLPFAPKVFGMVKNLFSKGKASD